ncbi:uncharacterized protein IWZ02DRAFT_440202 [Phyllosticta citriasiana]|uniref:uncharacterized protein n=1 Tax=Phyllosticta citriasiana TaxID=595635 RepID=UPI0030FDDF1A
MMWRPWRPHRTTTQRAQHTAQDCARRAWSSLAGLRSWSVHLLPAGAGGQRLLLLWPRGLLVLLPCRLCFFFSSPRPRRGEGERKCSNSQLARIDGSFSPPDDESMCCLCVAKERQRWFTGSPVHVFLPCVLPRQGTERAKDVLGIFGII